MLSSSLRRLGRGQGLARGVTLAGLLLALTAAPAAAQLNDSRAMIDRIDRLEAEVNSLQRQLYRGEPARVGAAPPAAGPSRGEAMPGDAANRIWARLDEIESLLRELTGRVEQAEHRVGQAQQRLDRLVEDIDFRLNEIEKRGAPGAAAADAVAPKPAAPAAPVPAAPTGPAAAPAPLPAPPAASGVLGTLPTRRGETPAPAVGAPPARPTAPPQTAAVAKPPVQLPAGSPQERYNYAFKLLRQGDYVEAEQAFSQFVAAHPGDALAGNAQYWLGETHYVRNDYQKAASAFLAGYQKYPKSGKAPDSLLKLGMSLNNLGQKQEACAVLDQLNREFPAGPAPVKQLAATERTRAGCK